MSITPATGAPGHSADSVVPVLRDEDQILEVASGLAIEIERESADRDRERRAPLAELAAVARSGLLSIDVPLSHGGGGASRMLIVEVLRRIARADSSVGQAVLSDFGMHELLRTAPGTEPATRMYAEVLAGRRIGNAFAERGGDSVDHLGTVARPDPEGGWRIDGRKYYATGVIGASWIAVRALRAEGHAVFGFVPVDAPGVVVELDDWSSFGQRTTFSGTVTFEDVHVPDDLLVDHGPEVPVADRPPNVFLVATQVLHAAVDIGVARAALEDGAAFVRERARRRPEAGGLAVSEESIVLYRFGAWSARLHALEALLDRGARAVEELIALPAITDEAATKASLAVAEAKALTQELGVEIASSVLEMAGASAADARFGLDRHWRNIRTHSVHDPARWKYVAIGNHLLNGVLPPRDQVI